MSIYHQLAAGMQRESSLSLLSNLVAYWKLNEPSNAAGYLDSHGAFDLGRASLVEQHAGKIAGAARLASDVAKLWRTDTNLAIGTNGYCMSLWFYILNQRTSGWGSWVAAFRDASVTGKVGFQLYLSLTNGSQDSAAINATTMLGSNNYNNRPATLYATTQTWHHVLFGFDSLPGTSSLYFNGQLIGQESLPAFTPTAQTSALAFGNTSWSAGDVTLRFDGAIDEPAYWIGRGPTLEMAQALYNNGNGLPYESFT